MKKRYLLVFLLFGFLAFASPAIAQESNSSAQKTERPIDGLSIYPNPVTGGKVFISTTQNKEKNIEIFNILGKPVQKTQLRGRELDVSGLTPGIYILKIEEGDARATKKLIVK